MATYTFECKHCQVDFEIVSSVGQYTGKGRCPTCKKVSKIRNLLCDLPVSSIVKADSELKTIGDIAKRNTDKLSDDEKRHIIAKRDAEKVQSAELPKGMSRAREQNSVDKLKEKKVRKANKRHG